MMTVDCSVHYKDPSPEEQERMAALLFEERMRVEDLAPQSDLERRYVIAVEKRREHEGMQEYADREEDARATKLQEALSHWWRFDPRNMRANTKARISRAVQLYSLQGMRSESKIAAEFRVSRKQVSKWFKTFTDATGFKVVTHKRHESVRDHVHGPEHREGRKTVFHGEDNGTGTHDAEPGKDPFFEER
jgi:transposase-like protein